MVPMIPQIFRRVPIQNSTRHTREQSLLNNKFSKMNPLRRFVTVQHVINFRTLAIGFLFVFYCK